MIEILQVVSAVILGGTLIQAFASLYRVARQSALVKRREAMAFEGFIRKARKAVDISRPKRIKRSPGWTGLRKFYVEKKVKEADGITSFYLRPHDGKPLQPFLPGQYLTIEVKIPGQPKPLVRCYSLSDAPVSRDRYRITVKRIPAGQNGPDSPAGQVSGYLHDHVGEGATLNARAPSGRFFLDIRKSRPIVLVAGGVGITPVLSMLNTVCAFGLKRQVWLFYGVRNSREHAMKDHIRVLEHKYPNLKVTTCYSNPTPQCRKGEDYDHVGRVTVPLMRFLLPFRNSQFHICGPSAMMRSIADGLKECGVPEADIKTEAFGPASLEQESIGEKVSRQDQESITVKFAKSGKNLKWTAGNRNLLELAEANGIAMNSGCRAGQCGSCAVGVKSGRVRYVSQPGEMPDKGQCLACVAVPEGDMVIEA